MLLDWLEISRRHRLDADGLAGLVLLDLPDFDSIQASHRLEAERIVALADLVLWVVEPQKYADASLHDRYLRPLATHAEAMAVVLNQADLLAPADVAAWRTDMEALLSRDGVPKLPLVVVSARSGDGIPSSAACSPTGLRPATPRSRSSRAISSKRSRRSPPTARGRRRGSGVRTSAGSGGARGCRRRPGRAACRRRRAPAAGRARDRLALVRWLKRFKPDPLRRLRLPESPQQHVRTSMPPPTEVQRAQVASAARRLADGAATGLPQPWPRLVREAATAAEDQVADRLDRAVAGADLSVSRPRWWRLAGLLQTVFALAAAAGAVWLGALAVFGWLRIEDVVPLPELEGVPIPTWLVLGGAGWAPARSARAARQRRRRQAADLARGTLVARGVETVAQELVAVRSFTSSRSTRASVPRSESARRFGHHSSDGR